MRKIVPLLYSILFVLALSACGQAFASSPEATYQPPEVELPVNLPDAKAAARAYLDAWKREDYAGMYAMLTAVSQDAMTADEFSSHYESVADEMTLTGLAYEILTVLTNPDTAQVNYRVTLTSVLVGDVSRDTVMNLSLDEGQWRVQWDDTLVLP